MALRLSEFLERIRPTGAPGAPSEGELQHRHDRQAAEIGAVTTVLATFEADADSVIARARTEADGIRTRAQRRVHEVASNLPDHLAVAEARAAHNHANREHGQVERIRHESARAISDLQARADDQIPGLVDHAMALIWSQISPSAETGSPP